MRRALKTTMVTVFATTQLLHGGVAEAHACWNTTSDEASMATRTNAARSSAGLAQLQIDDELSKVARRHAGFMARRGRLIHSRPTRLARRVTNWTGLAENVGVGNSLRSLHRTFMASPTHRSNVLWGHGSHVGVGVVRSGGRFWVTVLFQAGPNPGTRFPMPSC